MRVVSSCTVWVETVEMLPTLSSTIHLTVVVPRVEIVEAGGGAGDGGAVGDDVAAVDRRVAEPSVV